MPNPVGSAAPMPPTYAPPPGQAPWAFPPQPGFGGSVGGGYSPWMQSQGQAGAKHGLVHFTGSGEHPFDIGQGIDPNVAGQAPWVTGPRGWLVSPTPGQPGATAPGGAPGAPGAGGAGAGGWWGSSGPNPLEGYLDALRSMGVEPTPEQLAAVQYGPAGMAAAGDKLALDVQHKQEADKQAGIDITEQEWQQLLNDPRHAPMVSQVMKILGDTDVIPESLRTAMASREADAAAGTTASVEKSAREATGGRGGAYGASMMEAARREGESNTAANRDTSIYAAEANRKSAWDAIHGAQATEQGDQGMRSNIWQWLSDLHTGTRYTSPDMTAGAGAGGLAQLLNGGGAGGGLPGGAPWAGAGAAGPGSDPRAQFFQWLGGLFGNKSLVGGNSDGFVTPQMPGIQSTAQAPRPNPVTTPWGSPYPASPARPTPPASGRPAVPGVPGVVTTGQPAASGAPPGPDMSGIHITP